MNLSTDGHVATVVKMGQRGNARGGYEALGREHIVALVFPNASGPYNIICFFVYLFAFICLFA